MALTRAQLLMGNSGQGPILTGQPQGVTQGIGITINANGTIDVNSQTVQGIMKLGQTSVTANAAYNSYEWPTATGTVGQQLTIKTVGASTTLEWNDPDMIPWTALGQLVVGTGVGTQVILNSGTNGQILIVDTSTPSGLAYTSNYVSTTSSTGAANIPAGPTGSQPLTPNAGAFRYNSDTTSLEFYNGGAWETVASSASTGFVEKTSNTGSAIIPAGTTLQQDASPADGYLRVNTDTGLLEFYNAGAWNNAGKTLVAGLGIDITSGTTDTIKAETPIQNGPPAPGTLPPEAIPGSLYWDNNLGLLFILYDDGTSTQWVQVTPVTPPVAISGSVPIDVTGGVVSLNIGLGGQENGGFLKSTTPIQNGPPSAGTGQLQAIDGSLYWDNTQGLLFIRYFDGTSTQWVQVTPVTPAPTGFSGAFLSQTGQTVTVSNGIITSVV